MILYESGNDQRNRGSHNHPETGTLHLEEGARGGGGEAHTERKRRSAKVGQRWHCACARHCIALRSSSSSSSAAAACCVPYNYVPKSTGITLIQ